MTKEINIGNVKIGGNNPIAIQSMTNTRTENIIETIDQIKKLYKAGCNLVRVSVPTYEAAKALKTITKNSPVPIIADIHYDYKLAIESIKNGAKKIRINPGNIGNKEKVKEIVKVANEYGIPIRVGANSGSISKDFQHLGKVDALCESTLKEVRFLESMGFYNIVISVKSSDVVETIKAYEKISSLVDYPLHLGVTEAGTYEWAIIKSSIALGHLLYKGIGDTIRISISGDPVNEVIVAKKILISLNLRKGPQIISCPTCGRTNIDVEKWAKLIEKYFINSTSNIKIAVLGCVVNGIGEGKGADIGIAGIPNGFILFKKGKIIGQYKEEEIIKVLKEQINALEE
ncbi:4-hydroxy-3-methylbut-2-en-1-yl diphosphate synthase [Thermosipho melanesiensis]|uniref:4-hydroxy-3-methylbut-2-en-1-yl diphosphate synthase (flavodoxin) n=2 Tax=Thermosipho melanesiensis TaxID=46541 RepID=A6LJN6_THEM4|nr:flavodoxin-dependent (E)-4-hydroxy-3-methylbut-2-enyl-diphosphate synthase [Thermosipho melanesiensis]ABR30137.1 1-hydroxy-2-methyl-2-(E)-butenyl 4-diphosphate synthase [Thermosipho melanesiensis BI429]APT73334.1 4-hydroxy-3-methylbut-2-en-1-yl diphosphate synthase [Thermosipho melanesiensis]OOC38722.1 4-hydroxy-3-methylbut-2-en-1-yl diphosphate synthase [Thermosipho melanesiensis]OOC40527.1 4-hydroxy-3-methylbut-2-en-1-yl diphosphate synthase [Thermosipho melanesiensis]OOC40791.1 4-hydroxy